MPVPANPPLFADSWSELADWLIGIPLRIAALVILAVVLRWVAHRLIDRVVNRAVAGVLPTKIARFNESHRNGHAASNGASNRRTQRAQTVGSLFKSIVTGVLVAVFATMILDQVGVNIAPIIASAGIVGLALGFGAQSLVKDYLSGIFLIVEDQYGVGDSVEIGGVSGTVEQVTLRVTRLRALDGTVWYIPNGEILQVGNKSQNWARAVIDVGVGYGEDLHHVQQVLGEVAHELWLDEDFEGMIIEEPEVTGVEALTADAVTIRVLVKTLPLKQWGVARELRARIKARLDYEGIEMPFPQQVVWHRDDTANQRSKADLDEDRGRERGRPPTPRAKANA